MRYCYGGSKRNKSTVNKNSLSTRENRAKSYKWQSLKNSVISSGNYIMRLSNLFVLKCGLQQMKIVKYFYCMETSSFKIYNEEN